MKKLEEEAIKSEVKDEKTACKDEHSDFDETSEGDGSDLEMIDENLAESLARDVNLPSNQDSKLWRLKVKLGMER